MKDALDPRQQNRTPGGADETDQHEQDGAERRATTLPVDVHGDSAAYRSGGRQHENSSAEKSQRGITALTFATALAATGAMIFNGLQWHEAHESGKVQVQQALAARALADAASKQADVARQLLGVARVQANASQDQARATADQAATQRAMLNVESRAEVAQSAATSATISTLRGEFAPFQFAFSGLKDKPGADGKVQLALLLAFSNVGGSTAKPEVSEMHFLWSNNIDLGKPADIKVGQNEIAVRPGAWFSTTEPFKFAATPAEVDDLSKGKKKAFIWGEITFIDQSGLQGHSCFADQFVIKTTDGESQEYVSTTFPKGFCKAAHRADRNVP